MAGATIVPGSWWFGRSWIDWPTSSATGVTAGPELSLLPCPGGPRSLGSPDGTLGGLALPPGLAIAAGIVWLLDRDGLALRRFDAVRGRFCTVPGWGGSVCGEMGFEAMGFGPAASVAGAGGRLGILDPDRGDLVVVASRQLAVQAVLRVTGTRLVAVAGHAARFYVLDDAGGVWVTTPAMTALEPVTGPGCRPDGGWDRIAVDSSGWVWRVDTRGSRLAARTPDGEQQVFAAADEVRDRFTPPAVPVDRSGRFQVPESLRAPGSGAAADWFGTTGEPVSRTRDDALGPPPYGRIGTWTSEPLDSRTLGCRWHRLGLRVVTPPGSTVSIATFTSADRIEPAEIPAEAWTRPQLLAGPGSLDRDGGDGGMSDLAVLSPRGRYLSLRIELRGDGWETPVVEELLVEPQAAGLERLLPAVYRSDDAEADFLRRFLAIFGTHLDQVEEALRALPARFSPRAVPDPLIEALAADLGVPLERGWSSSQRRAMLKAAPPLYGRRGTVRAVQQLLHAHLEASVQQPVPPSLPVIVEGFRERPGAMVSGQTLPLRAGVRTWSDDVVDRPVLGRRGQRDRITLVSVGDRLTDRFRVHAHRFTVIVPRPLLAGADARDRFERLITAEKPAHVAHEIALVEPRLVVGEQCRAGVDTYLGDWPAARLAGNGCSGDRLGHGLRLVTRDPSGGGTTAVGRGSRVGVGTVLV